LKDNREARNTAEQIDYYWTRAHFVSGPTSCQDVLWPFWGKSRDRYDHFSNFGRANPVPSGSWKETFAF